MSGEQWKSWSTLDCNSALAGVAKVYLKKLQSVQNMAACMVSGLHQSEHITPVLEDLHWLPVSQREVFKTALMVWKCVHGVDPACLSDLCVPVTAISGRQHLRSAVTVTLLVPRARTATGERSFAVKGPATWNRQPPALWSPDLLESAFKWALKMHLFLIAWRHWDVFMILALDINIQTYLLTYYKLCWLQAAVELKKNTTIYMVVHTTRHVFRTTFWFVHTDTTHRETHQKQYQLSLSRPLMIHACQVHCKG